MRVARNRQEGMAIEPIATEFGIHPMAPTSDTPTLSRQPHTADRKRRRVVNVQALIAARVNTARVSTEGYREVQGSTSCRRGLGGPGDVGR